MHCQWPMVVETARARTPVPEARYARLLADVDAPSMRGIALSSSPAMSRPVVEVRDLTTHLVTRWGTIRAVDGVSFKVAERETLGLVGESGSGKTMTCLSIVRLTPRPAARILGGSVWLDGEDLLAKSEQEMQRIRGRKVAMILQDPMSSLNPVFSVGMQVREPVSLYHGLRGQRLSERAAELLAAVRIPSPATRLRAFPHQLSGGMRQRVVGAMAIAGPPRLLIADEPTTSLDLTIQAQYLTLLEELQDRHGLAMIFITHNLGIVSRICDRVGVMYAGRIVEMGPVRRIFTAPSHPYTRALLESIPRLGAKQDRLIAIDGQPPDLARLAPGCAFAPRCPHVMERCRTEAPPEVALEADHSSRCWLHAPA
jgi:oligopeptide/dipeptide ABC transporter ATP-binding protein